MGACASRRHGKRQHARPRRDRGCRRHSLAQRRGRHGPKLSGPKLSGVARARPPRRRYQAEIAFNGAELARRCLDRVGRQRLYQALAAAAQRRDADVMDALLMQVITHHHYSTQRHPAVFLGHVSSGNALLQATRPVFLLVFDCSRMYGSEPRVLGSLIPFPPTCASQTDVTHTHTHTHTHARVRKHAHMHAHRHTQTYTLTHTHTHDSNTYTYTHTLRSLQPSPSARWARRWTEWSRT
jgi:hypothetical protein